MFKCDKCKFVFPGDGIQHIENNQLTVYCESCYKKLHIQPPTESKPQQSIAVVYPTDEQSKIINSFHSETAECSETEKTVPTKINRTKFKKVLIWIGCVILYGFVQGCLGYSGVRLGAIPTWILVGCVFALARFLCKLCD